MCDRGRTVANRWRGRTRGTVLCVGSWAPGRSGRVGVRVRSMGEVRRRCAFAGVACADLRSRLDGWSVLVRSREDARAASLDEFAFRERACGWSVRVRGATENGRARSARWGCRHPQGGVAPVPKAGCAGCRLVAGKRAVELDRPPEAGYRARFDLRPKGRCRSVGAWLSLVERCVRDAKVGGSNPLAPTSFIPVPPQDFGPFANGGGCVQYSGAAVVSPQTTHEQSAASHMPPADLSIRRRGCIRPQCSEDIAGWPPVGTRPY